MGKGAPLRVFTGRGSDAGLRTLDPTGPGCPLCPFSKPRGRLEVMGPPCLYPDARLVSSFLLVSASRHGRHALPQELTSRNIRGHCPSLCGLGDGGLFLLTEPSPVTVPRHVAGVQ